jgi:hypothetical protein
MSIVELMMASLTVLAGSWAYLQTKRTKRYVELVGRVREIVATDPFEFNCPVHMVPSFDDRIAVVPDFLPQQQFAILRAAIIRLLTHERSFVPTHKKGGLSLMKR